MDIITTQSRGTDFVEVDRDIVLEDTPRTRIVFKAAMHSGGIRGEIIRYRKDANGACSDIVPVNFNSLHANDSIKIELPTDAAKKLYDSFRELETILEERGVQYGSHDFTVVDANALVIDDRNKAVIIRRLIDANYGEDVWNQLAQNDPDIASRLATAKLHEERVSALNTFEAMIANDNLAEADWQQFFESNTWIFGYGLKYQILRVVQNQPNYGGATVTGTGGQRGDFLTATEAETKYTCLVEIKKPTTELLQRNQYRNGAWGISNDLSGAVSQIQVNCAQWELSGARTEQNREILGGIVTVAPRGIVVIGNTTELDNWGKKNSFERFRREIRNPEIITYDELLERARFIVGLSEERPDDEELPF